MDTYTYKLRKSNPIENPLYTLDTLVLAFEERYVRPFDLKRPLTGQYGISLAKEQEIRDWSKKTWVTIDVGSTLKQLITHPKYVVPGTVTVHVFSKNSERFMKEHMKG